MDSINFLSQVSRKGLHMKKVAFGIACGITAIFVFALMLTLYGRSARQTETNTILAQAVNSTLSHVMGERNDTIEKNEDFIADFLQALLVQKNSDSYLTVSILEADYEYGILSVEITEKFRHPNGKKGAVSEMRTVIFDKPVDREPEMRTVSFYMDDELYKEYTIPQNSVCAFPVTPKKEGARFRGFRFVTGGSGMAASLTVDAAKGKRNVLSNGGAPYRVSENTKLIAVFD